MLHSKHAVSVNQGMIKLSGLFTVVRYTKQQNLYKLYGIIKNGKQAFLVYTYTSMYNASPLLEDKACYLIY
jgi:hypothetical protein